MKKIVYHCDSCKRVAVGTGQLRREDWIRVVWLDHHKQNDQAYNFCSIECLAKELKM